MNNECLDAEFFKPSIQTVLMCSLFLILLFWLIDLSSLPPTARNGSLICQTNVRACVRTQNRRTHSAVARARAKDKAFRKREQTPKRTIEKEQFSLSFVLVGIKQKGGGGMRSSANNLIRTWLTNLCFFSLLVEECRLYTRAEN